MSSTYISDGQKVPRRRPVARPKITARSPSASEIARNVKNFETWSTHQGCEQVSYSDIPDESKMDIDEVFNVTGRLPTAWVDKNTQTYQSLLKFGSPPLLAFIQDAYQLCPALFSDDANNSNIDIPELYAEISIVFSAWRRLQWMRKSGEKWSEADYVANVYNVFRSPAIRSSTQRVHCSISLPQPLLGKDLGTQASRILGTKTVVPDCTILVAAAEVRPLSHSAKSPFKILNRHPTVVKSGNASKGSSFRYQSTPCAVLPDTPCFEFASCFWEDKKPVHQLLEDAYRQNRMATASALRHLHSLRIRAPVFGLVWASGAVRAHVDWCKVEDGKPLAILSAPYPGTLSPESDNMFFEWHLDRPSDILAVYFLIRNLDRWTNTNFRHRVIKGVNDLQEHITTKSDIYQPWKRFGDLALPLTVSQKENLNNSVSGTTESSSSSPPRPTHRRHRTR